MLTELASKAEDYRIAIGIRTYIEAMIECGKIEQDEAIAHAFSYMKLMEHWGNGIPRIIESVVEAGLREPEFIEGDIDL